MLPGFRFLVGAIVLSMSLLIFGLGAAALLRTAHEEFASIPSRRAPSEAVFAQRSDRAPTLALARIEPPTVDQDISDPRATDTPEGGALPTDQPPTALAPPEPESPAADPAPTDIASAEAAAPPEAPGQETSAVEIAVETETLGRNDVSSAADETRIAATAAATPPEPDQAAASDRTGAPADDSTRIAETKIATLGGPPVTIEARTPSKRATPVARRPAPAKRVAKRRKIAQRERPARPALRQPAPRQFAPRQPANPFGTPFGS